MSNLTDNKAPQKALYLELLDREDYEKLNQLVFTDSHYDQHRLYKGIFELIFSHNAGTLRSFLTDSIIRESKHIDVKTEEDSTLPK